MLRKAVKVVMVFIAANVIVLSAAACAQSGVKTYTPSLTEIPMKNGVVCYTYGPYNLSCVKQ